MLLRSVLCQPVTSHEHYCYNTVLIFLLTSLHFTEISLVVAIFIGGNPAKIESQCNILWYKDFLQWSIYLYIIFQYFRFPHYNITFSWLPKIYDILFSSEVCHIWARHSQHWNSHCREEHCQPHCHVECSCGHAGAPGAPQPCRHDS